MPCHEQSGTEASGSKSSGMPAPLTENGNGNGNGNDASRNLKIASIINGSASSSGSGSGSGPDQAPSPTDSVAQSRGFEGADRTEVTRIMIQALENLGYQQVANELAQQSGCRLETPAVSALRSSILDGAWDKTEAMLKVAVAGPQDSNTQPELCLRDGVNIKEIIYLVRQQKFFELLQEQQSFKALNALRNELNPLVRNDDNELKFLTSLLMCVSPEAVRKRGNLPDTIEEARQNLLNKISKCISPQVMLPEKRLENIFKEVRLIQQKVCTRHTCPVTMSLLEDHQCNPANFPSKPAIDLADLDGNEVWQVRFSDCGSKLAASDDKGNLAIWETECFTLLHKIEVHSKGITNFAWSPDGTKIVTCSSARNAVLIDATVGEVLKEAASFAAECTSCAWTPDGRFFWLSTLDETKNLGLYSATGDLVREMNQTFRVLDMCLSPDGGHIVLVCQQWWIYVLDAETGETKAKYRPSFNPISITMGRDPNTLLANAKSGELVLLDVMTGNAKHKLLGPGECGAVIRGSIGGADESYIVSGSDSGNLYIWHAFNGSNVESIKAQPLRTNSACFNPADPTMIASCSDDGLVKIWTGTDKADVLYNKHHSARPPNGFSNGSRHMHLNSQRSHPSWDDSDGRVGASPAPDAAPGMHDMSIFGPVVDRLVQHCIDSILLAMLNLDSDDVFTGGEDTDCDYYELKIDEIEALVEPTIITDAVKCRGVSEEYSDKVVELNAAEYLSRAFRLNEGLVRQHLSYAFRYIPETQVLFRFFERYWTKAQDAAYLAAMVIAMATHGQSSARSRLLSFTNQPALPPPPPLAGTILYMFLAIMYGTGCAYPKPDRVARVAERVCGMRYGVVREGLPISAMELHTQLAFYMFGRVQQIQKEINDVNISLHFNLRRATTDTQRFIICTDHQRLQETKQDHLWHSTKTGMEDILWQAWADTSLQAWEFPE